MAYISAIAIDFGSSNSGVAHIDHFQNGKLTFTTPTLPYSDGYYAKDSTWFFIHPKFLSRAKENWSSLNDKDFKILSRINSSSSDPNVIWGRHFIKNNAQKISEEGWIGFKYFKMMIYKGIPYTVGGVEYPIEFVVRLFLRIIKRDCLYYEQMQVGRVVESEEIQWGVTIPSIWSDENKRMMSRICEDVFGSHVRILSEPEGPVVAERLHSGTGDFVSRVGHKSFVVDAGGGTTDLCIVEDAKSDTDIKFNLLASSDGIGLGGNNIDENFERYFLRFISRGLTSESNITYDRLSDQELRECIFSPYIESLEKAIEFEDEWQRFKHSSSTSFKIPKDYRIWLKQAGHSSIADRIGLILMGDIELGKEDIYKEVFSPVYDAISGNVKSFLEKNEQLLDLSDISLVFAGGLSMSQDFRNVIHRTVNDILKTEVTANIAYDSVRASGSIMEGASYILLNRKAMKRKAKSYLFDVFSNISLTDLRRQYANIGVNIKLGVLNEIAEKDIENNGGYPRGIAAPVAIKGEYYKDYIAPFKASDKEQKEIRTVIYEADDIVVHPFNNSKVREICNFSIPNSSEEGYTCTIDFNESEIGCNMHCFVTRDDTGELLFERNYPINDTQQ